MTDSSTIHKVAKLARIGLTEEETTLFQKDLTRMMDFFSILSQVSTQGVSPLFNPAREPLARRTDTVIPDGTRDMLLQNAPLTAEGMFLVPTIVETA